ncbi:ATPase [Achlya hypogyna]|uniref:ATPase n=1 Tax=Achlya hypogyna TaxID=1202772 RepID=A0A1V9YLX7_ACHHY|nr:ATPase [Achlya hypogyna]
MRTVVGRAWRPALGAIFAAPLSCTLAQCKGTREDLSDPLPQSAVASFLKQELNAVRSGLPSEGTKVIVSSLQGTSKLAFPVPRDPAAKEAILLAFLQQLQPQNAYPGRALEIVPSAYVRPVSIFRDIKLRCYRSAPTMDYVFADGSGSVRFWNDQFVLYKDDPMTKGDIVAFAAAYKASQVAPGASKGTPNRAKALEDLAKLGLAVYDGEGLDSVLNWDSLAGYAAVKTEIQDTVVLALQNPDLYEAIAHQTRCRFESNRPRAILFEGPPGTGKTLSARIIAAQAGVPLVHIPVESVVSKWFGESEKKMAAIFDACEQLEGALIFIDEIDALATERSSGGMHEASRRMLSVLLQKLEGFQSAKKVTLIAATNRKQDLDAALLSRFNLCIRYDLPDETTRQAVFQRYAKQLSTTELAALARLTQGQSCRDIKEVCEYTERKWASRVLRGDEPRGSTPTVAAYTAAVEATFTKVANTLDI